MTTTKPPIGFLCYVWKDDEHDSNRITRLRSLLSGEIGGLIGDDFPIFQDRTDLKWGEVWRDRIEQSLDAVSFLFPVITPRFFRSQECRRELERFFERERRLGRPSLVMPIYYITYPPLEDRVRRSANPLILAITERQFADWRKLRFEPLDSQAVRAGVAACAAHVAEAVQQADSAASADAELDAGAGCGDRVVPPAPTEERLEGETSDEIAGEGRTAMAPARPLVARLQRHLFKNIDDKDWEYFEFVTRHFVEFIYDRTPYFREEFSSDVLLRELSVDELYGDGRMVTECGYLHWQRDMSYYLRSLRDDCPDDIVTQTSNVIDPAMLAVALRHARFGIEIRTGTQRGPSLLNWDIARALKPEDAEQNAALLRTHGLIEGEASMRGRKLAYSVRYQIEETGDPVLDLSIRVPWVLSRPRIWVRGWEQQLLRRDENFYHLNIRHPTRGIRAQMRLGHGLQAWSVLEPTLAPDKYPKEPAAEVPPGEGREDEPVARPDPHYRNVTLPSWVLPGIALLLEWRYPMTDRLFTGLVRVPDTS